jgi:hypothetical protein
MTLLFSCACESRWSASLARGDHVDVQRLEQLGVRSHRVRQARAFVDLVAGLGQRGLQARVFHLLDQRGQRLYQRHTRVQERRQLAREQRQVL